VLRRIALIMLLSLLSLSSGPLQAATRRPLQPVIAGPSTDAPRSYTYAEAVVGGIIPPVQQKLPWCAAPDPGYATASEAEAHALDAPTCQANPAGFTILGGGEQSMPSPAP